MKKLIFKPLAFISLLMLSGCPNLGFVYEEHLTDNYYLIGVDTLDDITISYRIDDSCEYQGVVGNPVRAAAWNEKFILFQTVEKDKNFYIIEVKKLERPYDADKNVEGPFSHEEWLQRRKELNVPKDLELKKVP